MLDIAYNHFMEKMTFCQILRSLRNEKGFTQEELGEKLGVSRFTVLDWESGKRAPNSAALQKLTRILETSVAYLMGETDKPSSSAAQTREGDLGNSTAPAFTYPQEKAVRIPVITPRAPACAGAGFDLSQIYADVEEYSYWPQSAVRRYDPERPPFISYVEGDSMEEAGILDGAQVLVNPSETVFDGDPALVYYGAGGSTAIKFVYFMRDGSVQIRSSNSNYPSRTFTKEDIDLGFFNIVGKVVSVIQKPKRFS